MGFSPSAATSSTPNPQQVGQSFQQMLSQLYASGPGQFQQQATFQPQYTQLATQNLGTAASGSLDAYLQQIIPGLNLGAGNIAGGNAATIAGAGPATASAISSISPQTMGLNNLLGQSATTELQAGSQLPAGQVDQTLNAVNQNWASRGLGGTTGNQLADALQLYAGGQQQLSTAQNAAGSAISTGYDTAIAPVLSTLLPSLVTPGQAAGSTEMAQNIASGAGPSLYSTSALESLLNSMYNAQGSVNIANQNAQTAASAQGEELLGSVIGGGESALGSGGSASL